MEDSATVANPSALTDLQQALRRLDERLKGAIAIAETRYGPAAATDPHRGLYLSLEDVNTLLARPVGEPLLSIQPGFADQGPASPLGCLKERFQLSDFDLDLLLVALAPEIDLRYERLYAYLQDDVTRKRPSVDLALNLLCHSLIDKLEKRQRVLPGAPLVDSLLVHREVEAGQGASPLLAQTLRVDGRIVQYLLGEGATTHLHPWASLDFPVLTWDQLPWSDSVQADLRAMMQRQRALGQPLRLYLQGQAGVGKRRLAAAIATELRCPLLGVDLAQAPHDLATVLDRLRLVHREAQLQAALLYLSGIDRVLETEPTTQAWLEALGEGFSGPMVLAGQRPWPGSQAQGWVSVALELPRVPERQRYWQLALERCSTPVALGPAELGRLADQFRLTPEQIDGAIALARQAAH